MYDGSAHSDSTVTVTEGELLSGDTLVATATGSVTNVADTKADNNPIADGYKAMHRKRGYYSQPDHETLPIINKLDFLSDIA